MVAPARSRSPESAVESRPTMSALDRVLKAVRAGWTDYNNSAEASVAAQARFARRIGHGDTIQIEGETWRIIDITKGDDEAPVIIENGKIHRSIASLDLERVELAARLIRSVDEPEVGTPAVVPTGTRREPVVVSETAPVGPKVPLKLRYGAVDVSEAVEDRARDTAEESLHAEKKDAGFFAKIFKHNIAYEVYRQIAISRSRSKILSEKNLYASDNLDRDAHRRATGAVVDRFLMDHDEFLHSEGKGGEKKKVFGDSAEEKVVKKELEALVREYATNPDMDAAELAARRDEIFASASKLAGDAKGRGVMHADNLEKLADQVRQQAAHAGGLANLDLDLEIVIGKAKLGARTERDKNLVDRGLEWLERDLKKSVYLTGVMGMFRNEIAVAVGATIAIGNIVARTTLSSTMGKLATFGGTAAVTGAYSWWKEKGRLNSERSLHERQMTLGGETRNNETADEIAARESALLRKKTSLGWWQVLDKRAVDQELEDLRSNKPLQPRRKEMEGFELARESAKTMALGAMGFLDASGKELRGDVSVADATIALADIEARIRISNKEKIDLLKYTNVAEAEVERRNLDLARMQLKAALRKTHDGAFSTVDKKEFKDFQAYFDHIYSLREGALYGKESETQKQQKKFREWSNGVAVKRGLTTMAIGAGVGLVGHELWALGTGGDTTVGSMWAALKAYFDNAPVAAVGPANIETIGGGMFTTPPGTDLVPQADGSYILESVADHSPIASGLHIDDAGQLDATSMTALRDAGANIVETDRWINSSSTVTTTEGTWDWLRHHFMQKIHRDNWMDNDTPMHFSEDLKRWLGADLNELKLEWGGIMGPDGVHPIGLDANGQIVMTMGHMTPDGSFHDALSEDAPAEIIERKVRLLLTMNSGSQNSAIELMSDQRGQFHIDPNSDIGKTFFRVEHGKVVPLYYHAEVGISKGFDASGVNHFNILATHIGKGTAEGITSTDIGECIDQHVTQIGLPTSHEIPPVAIPPFVPIRRRQPMEPLKKGKGAVIGGYGDEYVDEEDSTTYSDAYVEEGGKTGMNTYGDAYVDDAKRNEDKGAYDDRNAQDNDEYIHGADSGTYDVDSDSGERIIGAGTTESAYELDRGPEVYDIDDVSGYEKGEGPLDSQSDSVSQEPYGTFEKEADPGVPDTEQNETKPLSKKEVQEAIDAMTAYTNTWAADYRRTVDSIISTIPPMEEECRMSIALPAYQEGRSIYEALRNYVTVQVGLDGAPLDPKLFEVNILLNRPNVNRPFDQATIAEVERFKADNPEARVNLLRHTFAFEDGKVKMGAIYKLAADAMLARSLSRTNELRKARQIFRTGGADAREKNPRFIATVINQFESDNALEQLRTESRQPKNALERLPLFHVASTVESAMSKLYTNGKSNIGLGSYSARVYAKAGGFNEGDAIREEVILAGKIRSVIEADRGRSVGRHLHMKNAIDDPRRGIEAMYRGIPYNQRYNKFADEGAQRRLREFDWEREIQKPIPPELELTPENLSRELSATFRSYIRLSIESGSLARRMRAQKKSGVEIENAVTRLMQKKFNKLLAILGIGREGVDFRYDTSGPRSSWRVEVKNVERLNDLMAKRKFTYWEGY